MQNKTVQLLMKIQLDLFSSGAALYQLQMCFTEE